MENKASSSTFTDQENRTYQSDHLIISRLTGNELPFVLKFFGGLYFLLSFIGGVVLWANHSDAEDSLLSIGIIGVITSIIVLLICLGIAKTIEQNSFIIKKLTSEEE